MRSSHCLILFIGFLGWGSAIQLVPAPCRASSTPEWATKLALPEDSDYKYYVGRAEESNEKAAFDRAITDAYTNAARENFGSTVRINSESYETIGSVTSTKRLQEQFKDINFDGFQNQETFVDRHGDRVTVYVKYRYLKSAIASERLRLITVKADEKVAFSEQGSDVEAKNGVLEVVTHPLKATVFIDGEAWGRTPMRIKGQLSTGVHKLRIDHSRFESVEEDFIVAPSNTTRIEKTLVRAHGKLTIRTNPPEASIILNGRPLGLSPIEDVEIPSGERIQVEAIHIETEKRIEMIEAGIARNEHRILDISLTPKPAYLSVTVNQPGAIVYLDGVRQTDRTPAEITNATTSSGKIQTTAGQHELAIEKDGFDRYVASVNLRGGQAEVMRSIELTPVQPAIERLKDPPFVISAPISYSGSTVQAPLIPMMLYGVTLQWKPTRYFGLSTTYLRGSRSAEYSNATIGLTSQRITLGLPVFISRFWRSPSLFLQPEWIAAWNAYSVNSDTALPAKRQQAYGGKLGYRISPEPEVGQSFVLGFGAWIGFHKYYFSEGGFSGGNTTSGGVECLVGF